MGTLTNEKLPYNVLHTCGRIASFEKPSKGNVRRYRACLGATEPFDPRALLGHPFRDSTMRIVCSSLERCYTVPHGFLIGPAPCRRWMDASTLSPLSDTRLLGIPKPRRIATNIFSFKAGLVLRWSGGLVNPLKSL